MSRFDPSSFFRDMDALFNPPWLRQMERVVKAVVPEVPRAIREIEEIASRVAVSPLITDFLEPLKWLSLNDPKLEAFFQWLDEVPDKLKAAFADSGVMPHPSLSWSDIRRLIREFENNGTDAAVAQLLTLHEELLADQKFREELRKRWEAAGRWAVMSDVLSALDAHLYFAAVATAIVQAEGLVAQTFGFRGRTAQKALIKKLNSMHVADDADSLFGPLAEAVSQSFFGEFWHGSPIVGLTRHAIAHGADVSYGTRPNAIAVIVWVDYVLTLSATEGVRAMAFRSRSLAKFRSP